MQKKNDHLALFAKYWQPGKVKTRLASKIGDIAASDVYQAFLKTLLQRLKNAGDHRTIVYSPPEREPEFGNISGQDWTLFPQSSGELGERLINYSNEAFRTDDSNSHLVIIGSDCLEIDQELIEQAFSALKETQVVLGPSHDGGYYLIGMSKHCPDLFHDIAWSTDSVFAQTTDRIRAHNLSFLSLPTLTDVDEFDNLKELQNRLVGQGSSHPDNANLLAAINTALNSQ